VSHREGRSRLASAIYLILALERIKAHPVARFALPVRSILAIPCPVCKKGFCKPKAGPDGLFTSNLIFHKNNYPVATFTLEPYECDVCHNLINFQAAFPQAGLQGERKPRVNAQRVGESTLRWELHGYGRVAP